MISRIFTLLSIVVFIACNPAKPKSETPKEKEAHINTASLSGTETPKSIKKQLAELAPNLKSADGLTVNKEVAIPYIQQIKMLANRYPNDIEVPKLLSTAAELCRGINEVNEALALYGQVYTAYPNHPLAAPALFIQGFILENELEQKEKAKVNYQTFLKKFPNHEFAEIVKSNLLSIDKSPDELIQEFKAKNQNK